jgi:hypothetical protein
MILDDIQKISKRLMQTIYYVSSDEDWDLNSDEEIDR